MFDYTVYLIEFSIFLGGVGEISYFCGMKRILVIALALFSLVGVAQENQGVKLHFDPFVISPRFTMPELPVSVSPATNIKPTFDAKLPTAADLNLNNRFDGMADSLALYQQDWRNSYGSNMPRFNYDTNPYGRDWSTGGVITRVGNGYLKGSGAHMTYLGMGNMASASVAFTLPMGERMQVTAGVTGSKYHFDRNAWNDYGVFGNASFRLNDRLSLNAFGQYYVNQQFHSVAAMPFLGSSSYGGTLGWKASDNFSLDVGARRIYDPYTGTWRTLPVVQPTLNLFGPPISFDAGPLIYQWLGNLFGSGKKGRDWGDPKYRPVTVPDAVRNQPGFNANSPVPIPDAFRH